jgi:hypothetical protein
MMMVVVVLDEMMRCESSRHSAVDEGAAGDADAVCDAADAAASCDVPLWVRLEGAVVLDVIVDAKSSDATAD